MIHKNKINKLRKQIIIKAINNLFHSYLQTFFNVEFDISSLNYHLSFIKKKKKLNKWVFFLKKKEKDLSHLMKNELI